MEIRTVIVLEDEEERLREFKAAVASLGPEFKLLAWRDAPTMIARCEAHLLDTCLISLRYDLRSATPDSPDPGDGLQVAEFLAKHQPVCPVILHAANEEKRWSMYNEFHFAGWQVEIVPPYADTWIAHAWLPRARELIGA